MNPRLRLVLALVALVVGLANLALLLRSSHGRPEPLAYLLLLVVGVSWSFVGAGLVAWRRRPGNRTGPLMVAVGLAFSLNGLILLRSRLGFTLYFLAGTLPEATLGHLLAVFPDGRATTRLQRVFVAANYAVAVPLALVQLLLVDPALLGCPAAACPPGAADRPAGELVLTVSNLLLVLLVALLLWLVVTRWRQASAPRRRSLAPVVLVGVVLVAVYMVGVALMAMLPSAPPPAVEIGSTWPC